MGNATDVDKGLADGLKAAKSKRCNFVLVLKGGTDGALIVSKTNITAPAIAEAKKKSGGSAVLSGLVSYADGAYVFETAKIPSATAAQAVKTIVKRDAELSIKAVFQLSTDPELAAGAGASPATPSESAQPAAQSSESAYQARVKAISADLTKAISSGTPAGNEAKLKFSESQLFSRKKEFAQALTLLDAVEAQIKKALAAGTAQQAAGGKAAEQPAKAATGMDRLNNLKAAIKTAIGAGGPNAGRIQTLLATATGLLKNNDLTQANKVLDELEPLLAPSTGPAAADPSAEWKKKLADWTPAIKAAILAKGSNAAAITKLMAQASALGKPGGDTVEAIAKLTECYKLATAEGAIPPEAATARWNAARAVFVAKLQEEIKAVVATKDPDVGKAELELKAVLKQLNGKMETRQQAAEMDRYLKDDDVVADVCELAFDLKGPLLNLLAEIKLQLVA